MYRGTTPLFSFKLDTDIDLGTVDALFVTFKSLLNEVSFSKDDCVIDAETKTVSVRMTQEQTLQFFPGEVSVQIRLRVGQNTAYATPVKTVRMDDILMDGVI